MSDALFVSDNEDSVEVKKEKGQSPDFEFVNSNDDPVVEEIPIYASTGLDLYLYQYPTRSATEPFIDVDGTGVIASRIKSKSGFVEVDVPIGTSRFYDKEKGDRWDNVDKQVMGGVLKSGQGTYMLGAFKGKELHVNKINSVVQLRPQFQYFDKHITDEREAMRSTRAEPKTGEPRAIQMSAKSTSDLAPKFSGALSSKKEYDEERALEMQWFDRDSNQSWNIADKLFSEDKRDLIPTTDASEFSKQIQE